MTVIGLIRRRSSRVGAAQAAAPYIEQLQSFGYTLLHIFVVLFFIEVALRVWGMSLIRYAEGEGEQISMKVVSFGTTPLVAWLIWILTDTAIQHSLGLGGKSRPNTSRADHAAADPQRAVSATIAVIALIVAPANMGMNVTPLLAGAGESVWPSASVRSRWWRTRSPACSSHRGLVVDRRLRRRRRPPWHGRGPDHPYRAPARPGRRGAYHPFSEIKSIKNYSRQFGYAMFRWPVPVVHADRRRGEGWCARSAMELRSDRRSLPQPVVAFMRLQGVESFDNLARRILQLPASRPRRSQWRSSGRSTGACVGASTRPASNCSCRVSTYS